MKRHSLRPSPLDPRDTRYHFYKHFGAVTSFPDEYDADAGLTNPDQEADNRPTECTGYTVADIGTDEDKTPYSPSYNFMKTLELMNEPPETAGADLRTAFKVACTFGLLPKTHEPPSITSAGQAWAANQANWPLESDTEAAKNRKVTYLPLFPGNQDWFDSIRTALTVGTSEHRTVGMGTQWSPFFTMTAHGGVLPDTTDGLYWGHAYKAYGWTTKNGVPYLIIKPWLGTKRLLMSRATCNALMNTWGAYAATLQDLPTGTKEELQKEQVNFLEALIALYKNLLIRIRYGLG